SRDRDLLSRSGELHRRGPDRDRDPRRPARPRRGRRGLCGRRRAARRARGIHAPRPAKPEGRPGAGRGDRGPDRRRRGGRRAPRPRAVQQLERGLSRRLETLREEILQLEALIAYDIDFPEEDEGPVPPEQVERAWHVVHDRLARLLATAPEGERLHAGALVVI